MPGTIMFDLIRARLETDLDLAHKFVHGTDTETIVVESGEIPTLANMVKALPLSSKLDAATTLVNSAENAVQRAEAAIAVLQAAELKTLGYKEAALAALQTATEAMTIAQGHASSAQSASQNATVRADAVAQAVNTAVSAKDQANTAALNAAGYGYALSATSKTSLAVGTGSKSFSIGTGKQFVPKQWIIAVSGNSSMTGEVVSYANGNLTINATRIVGSGTHADWTIAVSGAAGAAGAPGAAGVDGINGTNGTDGAAGPQGPQGIQGPAGLQGAMGPAGPQGIKGDTGAAGAQGVKGDAGVDGSMRRYLDRGNVAGAISISFTAGQHQRAQVLGAVSFTFTNWPDSTMSGMMMLELVNGGAFAITWPTINWMLADGTFTQVFSSNGTPLQSAGTDFVMLWTRDGGATVYGKVVR